MYMHMYMRVCEIIDIDVWYVWYFGFIGHLAVSWQWTAKAQGAILFPDLPHRSTSRLTLHDTMYDHVHYTIYTYLYIINCH
jgi:galactitol-specific phosphotransferase system IIC component